MSADAAEARKDQEELAMLAGELGAKLVPSEAREPPRACLPAGRLLLGTFSYE